MLYTYEQTALLHQQTFAHLRVVESEYRLSLSLDRPEKKNALNPTLLNELAYALSYAHHQTNIRVVVLSANGSVFCAGADLGSFGSGNDSETLSTIPPPPQPPIIGDLFAQLHKPCIARLHAPVYAGGLLLVCGCLYVVATEATFFDLPEVKRGLFPMQVMQSLLQVMPARRVLDWCIRARRLYAPEALREGLVTHLAANDTEMDTTIDKLCSDICQNSPAAIRMGLKAYDGLRSRTAAEAHAYLSDMLLQTLQTQDALEGIKAFQQKRPPTWTGQ